MPFSQNISGDNMPKVSDQERNLYFDKIAPYRSVIEKILKHEKELLLIIQRESENMAFTRLALVGEMLNLTSYYIVVNGVSVSVLKVKNEDALNDARKSLYKAVIYLEQVVTGLVDAGFSEYEDKVAEIASLDAAQRYLLVRKIGLVIQLLKNAYGDNTKWKWSFVELEGRYAAVAKNILDMKNAAANTDPRSPNYEPTMYHLRLVRRLLSLAADRYREKYELSTNRIDDYKLGIDFLLALKRILIVIGNRDESEVVQKKIDIWSAKLALDMKKQQENLRKSE
jgi:phage gp36-like protein